MKHKRSWRKQGVLAAVLGMALLLGGCSGSSMGNVDIDPPTRGLLHALQQGGMANVSDHGYKVEVLAVDGNKPLTSGTDIALSLQVRDRAGKPVQTFTEDMTKLMHLMVVSEDLSSFTHIHPDYVGNGLFKVTANFPFGGDFLLIQEFMPDDQPVTVTREWLNVVGEGHTDQKLAPQEPLQRTVSGVTASLSMMPDAQSLEAGQMVMMEFHLKDERTGEPLVLEPYLGTSGHCVILNENGDQYVHTHAVTEMSQGSNVMFHAEFPAGGKYRVWGQFQYRGEVVTIPFDIEVKP
ncbi:hypothetical protein [Paenibacillus sp. MMS18-CY102]|uniref:hypothetical protein n=1 Tax=Paenibacillus sp. MMS18-CY102 TaxID=2682849 RepID=UPI0013664661|nr:hypothetical protein [Paenibacillus sp. MMS18-CY102]MWC29425.1 hypothetical protein [Paenibacillus sp. MMS18-CY102]